MKTVRSRKTLVPQNENNIRYFLMIILAFILLLPGALMVSTSIQASHQGSELSDIDTKIAGLERETRDLEADIISNTSLSEVSENSEDMGFKTPEKLIYIQQKHVAQLQ